MSSWLLDATYFFHRLFFLCSTALLFRIHLKRAVGVIFFPFFSHFFDVPFVLVNETARVKTGRVRTCVWGEELQGYRGLPQKSRQIQSYDPLWSFQLCANYPGFTCGWHSLLCDAVRKGVCWEVRWEACGSWPAPGPWPSQPAAWTSWTARWLGCPSVASGRPSDPTGHIWEFSLSRAFLGRPEERSQWMSEIKSTQKSISMSLGKKHEVNPARQQFS